MHADSLAYGSHVRMVFAKKFDRKHSVIFDFLSMCAEITLCVRLHFIS